MPPVTLYQKPQYFLKYLKLDSNFLRFLDLLMELGIELVW